MGWIIFGIVWYLIGSVGTFALSKILAPEDDITVGSLFVFFTLGGVAGPIMFFMVEGIGDVVVLKGKEKGDA